MMGEGDDDNSGGLGMIMGEEWRMIVGEEVDDSSGGLRMIMGKSGG